MKKTKKPYATTYHRDGTVTYWDVYSQSYVRRAPVQDIPAHTLATLSDSERKRIMKISQ